VAPTNLAGQAPEDGGEVDYDPELASTTEYIGPLGGGDPEWRVFEDGLDDGDLNLDGDLDGLAALDNVVSFLATYVEVPGDDPLAVDVCLRHDDAAQLWIDGVAVFERAVCAGRGAGGDCQGTYSATLEPGVHLLLLGVWEATSDWGAGVRLINGETSETITADSGELTFLGTDPGGYEPPPLAPGFVVSETGLVLAGTELTFDSIVTYSTVPVTAYRWDFGDGATAEGAEVTHAYEGHGKYTVTLTVEAEGGLSAATEKTVLITEIRTGFSADFAQDDGVPADWWITQGRWEVLDEGLVTDIPTTPEPFIYAGCPPYIFEDIETLRFTVNFLNPLEGDAVGRHGGVMIFAENTNERWSNSGYTIDWIDRASDRGYRFIRWDQGGFTVLDTLRVDPADPFEEPGTVWEVDVTDESLIFSVDGEEVGEVLDGEYRSGLMGMWGYFNGNIIEFDDIVIGEPSVSAPTFRRGDVDGNGVLEITDPINSLGFQFLGSFEPTCLDALDWDDNGAVEVTDPVGNLTRQFASGPPAPAPGSDTCGEDPTEDPLGCDGQPACN
jgi:PKD repeat protein